MEFREDVVDIIVPFFRTPDGERNLERLQKSLKEVDPGFPINLIIAEGQKPCVQNRNDGLRQSTSRYVVHCDDDVEFVEAGWLKKALDVFKNQEKIGMVGFRIENKKREIINAGRVIFHEPGQEHLWNVDARDIDNGNTTTDNIKNLIAGCCMVTDRFVAGFFPESIYPGKINAEDNDYQLTIQANGYKIYYLGTVSILHHEKTFEEKKTKYQLNELDIYNHMIFAKRWGVQTGTVKKKESNNDQSNTI